MLDARVAPLRNARLREELPALAPRLEIIMTRALGPGEDARDAVQEVLHRAVAALARGSEIHGPLGAFVHGIAQHVIADALRARARTGANHAAIELVPDGEPSPLESLIHAGERDAMRASLALLDPPDRELLRRCFVDGETVADIARATGEPADRIRKRKSRAIMRLREILAAPRHTSGTSTTTGR